MIQSADSLKEHIEVVGFFCFLVTINQKKIQQTTSERRNATAGLQRYSLFARNIQLVVVVVFFFHFHFPKLADRIT